MPREAPIVERTLAKLNGMPCCLARKLHGSQFSVKGDPDIYGCINGRMFVIEMKQPGEEPTPLQFKRLRDWADAGAMAGWAVSVDEALDVITNQGPKIIDRRGIE